MGNFQSMCTILVSRTPDEEEGGGSMASPNLQNQYKSNEALLSLSSIYKATKAILQMLCVYLRPRKASLPIQNCSSSTGLSFAIDDEEAPCENVSQIYSADRNDEVEQQHVVSVIDVENGACLDEIVAINSTIEEDREVKEQAKTSIVVVEDEREAQDQQVKSSTTKAADPSLPIQNPSPQICYSSSLIKHEKNEIVCDHVVSVPEIRCSKVEIKPSRKAKAKAKRIKHYSSWHSILLVGEGDFSFSACLAQAFGSAANIIATSLDSQEFLMMNYGNAMSNIAELRRREGKVMHEIDATKMANHELLGHLKFDRIIYNFPYAGIFPKIVPRETQLSLHRELVSKFLMNARNMISENGEIHISHKTNSFHADFMIESIASSHGLRLIEAVRFEIGDYPGYYTKSGFGGNANFDCYPSNTFKFGLN